MYTTVFDDDVRLKLDKILSLLMKTSEGDSIQIIKGSEIEAAIVDPKAKKEPSHRTAQDVCLCLCIKSKNTSYMSIYDRSAKTDANSVFYITQDIMDQLSTYIKELLNCIFQYQNMTIQIKWKNTPGEYLCQKKDPGIAHLNDEGRLSFEIRMLESTEKERFNSFQYTIGGEEMTLLLYKDGRYAHKGISPLTPLSYFGIDEKELLRITEKMFAICNPGKTILSQNAIDNHNAQINDSGCVYYKEKYFI